MKEYLESKEMKVVDMMMILFDEETIIRNYVEDERREAAEEAAKEAAEKAAKETSRRAVERMLKMGFMQRRNYGYIKI